MSPEKAESLQPGDYVAQRGPQDKLKFSHVGVVTKTTPKAFWAAFHTGTKGGFRIAFDDKTSLRRLRAATPNEAKGFDRQYP